MRYQQDMGMGMRINKMHPYNRTYIKDNPSKDDPYLSERFFSGFTSIVSIFQSYIRQVSDLCTSLPLYLIQHQSSFLPGQHLNRFMIACYLTYVIAWLQPISDND